MRCLLLLFVIIVVAGIGCKKNDPAEDTPFTNDSIVQCLQESSTDSAAIVNKLAGSWRLAKQECNFPPVAIFPDKKTDAVFKSSGSFTVYENGAVITTGSWKLVRKDDHGWKLEMDNINHYLVGGVSVCNIYAVFSTAEYDGCANLFKKNL